MDTVSPIYKIHHADRICQDDLHIDVLLIQVDF